MNNKKNDIDFFIDFLDGNQNKNEEDEFASKFFSNSEFRDSFKKYLNISKMLSTSSENYIPSDDSKKIVFNSLGFNNMIEYKGGNFFKSKTFTLLMSNILTCVVTILFFLLYYDNEEFEPNNIHNIEYSLADNQFSSSFFGNKNQKFSTPQNFGKNPTNYGINQIPTEKKTSNIKLNTTSKPSVLHNNKNESNTAPNINHYANASINSQESNYLHTNYIVSTTSNIENDDIAFLRLTKQTNDSDLIKQPAETQFFDTIFLVRSYDTKYRIEFKNTPSWFSSNPTIQPYEMNNFNNLAISFYYPIYKTILLGLDFRQETFYVEYDGFNNMGVPSIFYQQPNLTTYGLAVRYSPFDFSNKFKPYANFIIGCNISGIVTREMLGVEYYILDNVYFILGGEVHQFFFKHEKNWFSADKYSLHYGIGVKL